MSFVFALIKLLGINQKSFFVFKNFKGMPHRYEIFLKKKIVFLLITILRQHHFKQLNVR